MNKTKSIIYNSDIPKQNISEYKLQKTPDREVFYFVF